MFNSISVWFFVLIIIIKSNLNTTIFYDFEKYHLVTRVILPTIISATHYYIYIYIYIYHQRKVYKLSTFIMKVEEFTVISNILKIF